MAKTYLSYKIDRKCFKTIHSMYDKAKYCVNCSQTVVISDCLLVLPAYVKVKNYRLLSFSLFS